MLNEDLMLSKKATDETLQRAIATAAGVPASAVCVVGEGAVGPEPNAPGIAVLVERIDAEGDFPLAIEYWPRVEATKEGRLDEIKKLCGILDCRALADDGTEIPGRFLEVGASGPLRIVNLDGDKEVAGVYDVQSEEPLPEPQGPTAKQKENA